jgi:SAM-dependent methyltransferase
MDAPAIQKHVRETYGDAARRAAGGGRSSCCSAGSTLQCCDPITSNLYAADETAALPDAAVMASLGCGNPTALADLKPGDTVLDLGSGGGIDVLLSARRVGPDGMAYGVDMTEEMLTLAEENRRRSGLTNVEFLRGTLEDLPLPANSVDVIISNCVINLSADKDRVLREAFRVLKPGGRLAVSDIVVRGTLPSEVRRRMDLWVGCVAGALGDYEYVARLAKAGFEGIEIEPSRIYNVEDARAFLAGEAPDGNARAASLDGAFMSAFIRATKPDSAACCGAECCH